MIPMNRHTLLTEWLRLAGLAGRQRRQPPQVMRLDVQAHAEPEPHGDRYLFLDQFYASYR